MIQSFRDLKKLPRPVWILCLATLINRLGTMAMPYLALYLTRDQGQPATVAGKIIAIYGVAAFIMGPIAGRLVDKVGAVAVMQVSLIVSGIVLILFPLAHSLNAITFMVILWSLSSEAYRPASMTVIGDLVPQNQSRSAFVLLRLSVNLGMSVGPALGGLLATISYPSIFIVNGVSTLLGCVCLVVTGFKARAKKSLHENLKNAAPDAHSLRPMRNLAFVYFLLAITPAIILFFQHISAMPIYLVRDLKFPESFYGILFAINTAIIIVFEVPINAGIAEWTYKKTLTIGTLLFALGFGGLAFVTSYWGVIATVVIWTVGEMILFPIMNSYVNDSAPAKRRGQYMGAYMACFSGAFIISPWLGTYILEKYGGYSLWIVMLIFGMVSPLMLLANKEPATHKAKKKENADPVGASV